MKAIDELCGFSRAMDGNGIEDHLLCTATAEELNIFVPFVASLPQGARVVEIGTFSGRSASAYFQVQQELNLDIHLIDIWNWCAKDGVHKFVDMVLEHFNEVPFTYHKMPSTQLAVTWDAPIDFLYIDGEHELPGVERDFADWIPFLRSGGILAVHDTYMYGVGLCLDMFVRSQKWELLAEAERLTIWRKP